MFSRIAREDGLCGQHLEAATESAQERDFAWRAVFMGLRAAKFGQQLHFGPLEGDAKLKRKPAATQAKATKVRIPLRSSSCTSSQPRQALRNLKLSSTLQLWRYMVKMRTALCASVTGQSVSSSHGSQSTPARVPPRATRPASLAGPASCGAHWSSRSRAADRLPVPPAPVASWAALACHAYLQAGFDTGQRA